MKKIRLFTLCGIIGCALLFIGTTTISKQKMEIGGFLANKYLPPDAYAASDAAIAAGAAAGHFVGGRVGMAIGCAFGPVGGVAGYCVGRIAGKWVGAL